MTNEFNTAATRLDFAAIFGNAAAGSYVMGDVAGKGLISGLADQGVQLAETAPKIAPQAFAPKTPGLGT